MRNKLLLLALGILSLSAAGCLWSVHPLHTNDAGVFEPALLGVWATPDGEKTAIIEHGDDNSYEITYVQEDLSEGASGKYRGRLVRLGEDLFLDVYPDKKAVEALMEAKPVWYLLPTHTFYRLQLDGDAVTVSLVDDELVRGTGEPPLANEKVTEEDGYLLTASPTEMQAQLEKRAGDESIYVKLGEFRRLK
ncbi:MAG TPA: hypothetical protein VLB32_05915 [Candidatus Acidoferrales bacterium]|nr:hypothetical protein [Candidatus Acidoferrales bacterium]